MSDWHPSRRDFCRGIPFAAVGVTGGVSGLSSGSRSASGGEELWRFETDNLVYSSPTVVGDTVYVGASDDNVYALDAATGDERWRFTTDDAVVSSPTVDGGTLYVGSTDTNLYALDAATGDEQWHFSTGDGVWSSPTVADGTVYVGSTDYNLYAVDAATGDEQWRFDGGLAVDASPTVVGGTVYVGSYDAAFFAVDARTGDEQWRFEPWSGVYSSATVVDDTVYVGSFDDKLYALEAANGRQIWQFDAGHEVHSSPTVANGVVYFGSHDHRVYAVDAVTGFEKWTFETGDEIYSSPTVVDDRVVVGSTDAILYALDWRSGEELWRFDTGYGLDDPTAGIRSSPTVVDGTVYTGGRFSVHAFDAGVSGSSEGSRVRLETLGHHGETTDWNEGPIASFTVSPETPTVGEVVTLDAADTRDPDGRIEQYEWDVNGDGTYDATGETVRLAYESPGDRTILLKVTDEDGKTANTSVGITVREEKDDMFETVKQNHVETARGIDSASVAPLDEASRVQSYHADLTDAVESGEVPRDRAIEAVRRLDNAKSVSEGGIRQVGPAEDPVGSHNLARKMARPTIQTAFSIALSAANVTGKLVEKLPITGKVATSLADQLLGKALGTLLDTMLGSDSETKGETRRKCKAGADDLIQQIESGAVAAVEEVAGAIDGILEPIVDAVSKGIRAYFEAEMAIPITLLAGLVEIDLSIDNALDYLHSEFSVESLSDGPLQGTLSAVQTATNNESQDVSGEVTQAEDQLDAAAEFSNEFSIGTATYKLINGSGFFLVRVGTVLVAAINEIVGGVGNAFAFGAGVGSLMEIGQHNAEAAARAVVGEAA